MKASESVELLGFSKQVQASPKEKTSLLPRNQQMYGYTTDQDGLDKTSPTELATRQLLRQLRSHPRPSCGSIPSWKS